MKKALMIMAMVGVIGMAGVANAAGTNLQDGTATVYAASYDAGGGSEVKASYTVNGPPLDDGDVNTGDYAALGVNNAAIVMWDNPVHTVANVNQIVFYGHVFGNGGWFGEAPDLASIVAPTVQYTTDGGTTWLNATGQTDDYVAVVDAVHPADGVYGPATFDFDALGAVDGVRLYGRAAGQAAWNGQGFVRVQEIEVYAAAGAPIPEPAGLGLIGLALLAVRRRRS